MLISYTKEELSEMTPKNRLIYLMLVHEVNAQFHNSVVDIIVQRNKVNPWDRALDRMSENDKITVSHMRMEFESAIQAYVLVETLYEIEFGKVPSEIENEISKKAKEIVEYALITYGWK